MYLYRKIRFSAKIFILLLPIIGSMTLLSLMIAAGYDEGMINGLWAEMAYYSFYIFRFPTHTIIWNTDIEINPVTFIGGLFINVIFNSFVFTLIVTNLKRKDKSPNS